MVIDLRTGARKLAAAAHRILATAEAIAEAAALLAFIAMMLVTLLQVLTRYVLHASMPWTEELARTLFVAAMMVGIALAVRRREHIVVDFLLVRLGARAQAAMQIAFSILILFFLAIWLRGALRLIEVNLGSSFVTLSWLTVSDIYRIEAAAIAAMMLYVLLDIAQQVRALRFPTGTGSADGAP